ncbi:unnamed protein product [Adineta steineri]|uniref:Uncharacterized protein n=1 Tax=Adineta steineri TaxID=433720 RepID=A0A814Y954_9BILA|nr:unnamed protein product [Adineta steineri]
MVPISNELNLEQSIPELSAGGTIKQRYFNYRCRAAKGDWQAKSYQTRDTLEAEPFKSGYIIYNIHHNPVEILRRCATVGVSLYQTHSDRSIVYINRYDWSCHHDYDFEDEIDKLLGIDRSKPDHDFFWESSFHGRIMIIDSNSAMNIIKQWKFDPTELKQPQEKVFIDTRNETNDRVGLHLSIPKTDYDFAWLVFSSDQPDSELIAIVYDGSCTTLSGQIILDKEDVVSLDESELNTQEQARRNADLSKKMRSAARYRHN